MRATPVTRFQSFGTKLDACELITKGLYVPWWLTGIVIQLGSKDPELALIPIQRTRTMSYEEFGTRLICMSINGVRRRTSAVPVGPRMIR